MSRPRSVSVSTTDTSPFSTLDAPPLPTLQRHHGWRAASTLPVDGDMWDMNVTAHPHADSPPTSFATALASVLQDDYFRHDAPASYPWSELDELDELDEDSASDVQDENAFPRLPTTLLDASQRVNRMATRVDQQQAWFRSEQAEAASAPLHVLGVVNFAGVVASAFGSRHW